MLQYEVAKMLYDEMKEKAAKCSKEGFDEFYKNFLEDARLAQLGLLWTRQLVWMMTEDAV